MESGKVDVTFLLVEESSEDHDEIENIIFEHGALQVKNFKIED